MVRTEKCYVCNRKSDKANNLRLHKFPKPSADEARFKRWLHVLNLSETDAVRTLKVCSAHFTSSDYSSPNGTRKYLRPHVVPSIGVPNPLPPDDDQLIVDRWESDSVTTGGDYSAHTGTQENATVGTSTGTTGAVADSAHDSPSPEENGAAGASTSTMGTEYVHDSPLKLPGDYVGMEQSPPRCTTPIRMNVTGSHKIWETPATATSDDEPMHITPPISRQASFDGNGRVQEEQSTTGEYDLASLERDLQSRRLPKDWGYFISEETVFLRRISYEPQRGLEVLVAETVPCSMYVEKDMTVKVRARGKLYIGRLVNIPKISCKEDVFGALAQLNKLIACPGVENGSCQGEGFLASKPLVGTCQTCNKIIKEKAKSKKRTLRRIQLKNESRTKQRRAWQRKLIRYNQKLNKTQETVEELRSRCAQIEEIPVLDAIKNFPRVQQEAIKACLNSAKSSQRGVRYSNAWILECLLLRIKSWSAYKHIREHKILPLPHRTTLDRHLKQLKPSYGFCAETFLMLKTKAMNMKPHEKRGTLVMDEMKLSEAVSFDTRSLLFNGFTDLGEHTPDEQKNVRGDHALVFLYQPFAGTGVQTLGAFLSKGCASSGVLHKLVLECIILMENADFFIDVITTDGATWNRLMWKLFGLSENDNSCAHPCAEEGSSRRLYFSSDFHHLVKNFRNFLISSPETWTPCGILKLAHFRAVIACDDRSGKYGLRAAHKLTEGHIKVDGYKKMNVGLALQLLSRNVAAAMTVYRDQHDDLEDCDGTIALILKVAEVIEAMSSRRPGDALSVGSAAAKTIEDFIQFLEDWRFQAGEANHAYMSNSTHQGFMVTLRTALDLCSYLSENCDFQFLMSARLNQDVIEGFFGLIRSLCGSHDHPNSQLFIQIYHLLSFYSLVKPPKGSNVENLTFFETLLSLEDNEEDETKIVNRDEWESTLDVIILKGSESAQVHRGGDEHDYNVSDVNEEVQGYVSGWVARRLRQSTKCVDCCSTLVKSKEEAGQQDALVDELSRGWLTYASNDLFHLLSACERAVLKTVGMGEVNAYTFLRVADNLLSESVTFVGCKFHEEELTRKAINYYTVARAKMLAKRYNAVHDAERKKSQKSRKMSKL